LVFTSGTVSIGTFEEGATGFGHLINNGNLILGAMNTLKLDFSENINDELSTDFNRTTTWGGTLAFNLSNSGAMADGSLWVFFGPTAAYTGHLDAITLTNSTAGGIYNGLSFSRDGNIWTSTATAGDQQFRFDESTGYLELIAVPEPSSIVLAGLGLAMLGWRRWRRSLHIAA